MITREKNIVSSRKQISIICFSPASLPPRVCLCPSLRFSFEPRGPTSASSLLLRHGPRSALAARRSHHRTCLPALARLSCNPCRLVPPSATTPARGRRGIDIYEVRWLVAFPYATFGHAGATSVVFGLGICRSSTSPISSGAVPPPGKIIPIELERANTVSLSFSSIDFFDLY